MRWARLRRARYSPFERRRRAAARVALYGSLALLAVAAVLAGRWLRTPLATGSRDQAWSRVKYAALPEVQLLQRYLRIDTSLETGSELAGAEFLAAELGKAGIPATIERLGEKQANLWAFLEGDDPRALVLHHHLDVEGAPDAARWMHPPFSGAIDGPWIYGRGAYDMKSVGVAQLLALLERRRAAARPRRSLLFLATSGEERGGILGAKWVLERHPELRARMWAVLTEGGVVEATGPGDLKYWGIEHAQKTYVTVTVCGPSREPLEALRRVVLADLRGAQPPRLLPEVADFLRRYAPSRGGGNLRASLADPQALVGDAEAVSRLPAYLRALLRDDLQPDSVREAAGGGYELRIVFHFLPGADLERARHDLLPDRLLAGFATAVDASPASPPSPTGHSLYQTVEQVVGERYPAVSVGPFLLSFTATDSRHFRSHGISSYGFSPFPFVAADTYSGGHGNERIGLPAFVEGVRLYGDLVRRLTD